VNLSCVEASEERNAKDLAYHLEVFNIYSTLSVYRCYSWAIHVIFTVGNGATTKMNLLFAQ